MSNELPHEKIIDVIGGEEVFFQLVDAFYELVENDDLLRPMYPEHLEMAKKKLSLFLIKKFGGKDQYTPLRGHPRMRRRHMKFTIGMRERNRWVNLMEQAMDEVGINEKHTARPTLQSYFEWMASHMINTSDLKLTRN